MKGEPLKAGWLGKSFACHQLACQASGDWLLFLDADVRLRKEALSRLIPVLARQKNGMVSGFPLQETRTWMERLIVPMMMFTIACHLPIRFIRASGDPKFAAAHGGFLAVEKKTYTKIGGHQAIRSALVDDMALAKAVKRDRFPFSLLDVHHDVYMRMYTNAEEVWKGYRKNLFPGVGKNPFLLVGILFFYALIYIFPVVLALTACAEGKWLTGGFGILVYLTGVLIKAIIDWRNGISGWISFFLPVSILFLIGIGIDSMRISYARQGYEWKGRRYP
jgi:glycosyltransferase involved in cell wall biosynthesis